MSFAKNETLNFDFLEKIWIVAPKLAKKVVKAKKPIKPRFSFNEV